MNELDKLIKELIKQNGGTRQQYLHLLNSVANHETGGTNDPAQKQIGGGPGRGKYQFGLNPNGGGITAAKRLKRYYKDNNKPIPEWLEKTTKQNNLDASTLSSEQQDLLFLGNMKGHPKANLGKVMSGEESVPEFWANYHWAGPKRQRATRLKSFNSTYKEQEPEEQKLPVPTKLETVPTQKRDGTIVSKPLSKPLPQSLTQQFALGGPIEPPKTSSNNNVKTGTDFVTNWLSHPETRKRYRQNISGQPTTSETNLGVDNEVFNKALTGLKSSTHSVEPPIASEPGTKAMYTEFDNSTRYFGKPTVGTATHEATHSAGDIDRNLSKYLMKDYGTLKSLRGKYPGKTTDEAATEEFGRLGASGGIKQAEYMGGNGELYPRIMEMRQFLNVKPGQPIDDEMINRLIQNKKTNTTARYYKPEVLKEMLNTVASNTNAGQYQNMAAYGGNLNKALYGGDFNSFNVGGSHESNPNGGIPLGTGSNGKPNTVEQGETSYNFKEQGKYIFSNRIASNGAIKR